MTVENVEEAKQVTLPREKIIQIREDPVNLEEQCGNAVFKICNARERYSKRCAEELGEYLNLQNKMAMVPVVLKASPDNFEIPASADMSRKGTSEKSADTHHTWNNRAEHLQTMLNKIQELKVVMKQLEDNRIFEIKHNFK